MFIRPPRCQRKVESSASLQSRKFRFQKGDGSAREGGGGTQPGVQSSPMPPSSLAHL